MVDGGAIDLIGSTAQFLRCKFNNNVAGSLGGAIKSSNSPALFAHCSFAGNEVNQQAYGGFGSGSGGAMFIRGQELLVIHNGSLSGNAAVYGGALSLSDARPILTNVTISGNRASTLGGGIQFGFYACSPLITNSLIWNNASAGSTTAIEASISVSTSNPTFSHSIVQHSGGTASWNAAAGADGGSNLDANPTFTAPLDPLAAPSTAGDFSLPVTSPANNAGLDTADLDGAGAGTDTIASVSEDLAGNPRFEGNTVDIGAHEYFEGIVATTFVSMFPALDPTGDDNGNGLNNFADYALGGDPTAAHNPGLTPSVAPGTVTFGYRGGASDVNPVYKKSTTLTGWTTMQPGVDYNVISSESVGDRILVTLGLLEDPGSNPRMFFIQEFPEP